MNWVDCTQSKREFKGVGGGGWWRKKKRKQLLKKRFSYLCQPVILEPSMNLPKFLWVLPSDKSSGHQVPHRNPWSGSTSDQYSWPTTVNTRLSTNILALAKVKSQWAFVASLPGYGIKAFRCEKGCGFVLSGTMAWNWVLLLNNLPLENRDSGLNRVGKIT